MNKIYLGTLRNSTDILRAGEAVYLSKHSWDCGRYWGVGYIGNSKTYAHFDSLLKDTKTASELFSDTPISDSAWWTIRDLFAQAYALKRAAEVYRRGGGQCMRTGVTDCIVDAEMVERLNRDLATVLDTAWAVVCEAVSELAYPA